MPLGMIAQVIDRSWHRGVAALPVEWSHETAMPRGVSHGVSAWAWHSIGQSATDEDPVGLELDQRFSGLEKRLELVLEQVA